VVHQGYRAGDDATRPGVEQGRHLLLPEARRSADREVDAGQQCLPRAALADAILHAVVGHAEGEQLPAGDHGELLLQELAQAV
jgi:hypothetical protein